MTARSTIRRGTGLLAAIALAMPAVAAIAGQPPAAHAHNDGITGFSTAVHGRYASSPAGFSTRSSRGGEVVLAGFSTGARAAPRGVA